MRVCTTLSLNDLLNGLGLKHKGTKAYESCEISTTRNSAVTFLKNKTKQKVENDLLNFWLYIYF